MRKPSDDRRKQAGIGHDRRANPQLACVRLFDELDFLEALAHFVKHRDSGFEQGAAVVRWFGP